MRTDNPQVNQLMLQALETEQGGIKVYETAIRCAVNDDLKKEWKEYLEQTREHERIVRETMERLGLDPSAESPGRQVVRHIGEGYHLNFLRSEKLRLVEIDADHWKTWVHQRLVTPIGSDGAMTLFEASPQQHLALAKHLTAEAKVLLGELGAAFRAAPDWSAPSLHTLLQEFAATRSLGLGKVAQPLRVALTGGTVSPPIDATLAVLGKERVLARLDAALQ